MGSEAVLKKIKNGGRLLFVTGFLILLVSLVLLLAGLTADNSEDLMGMTVFGGLFVVIAGLMMFFGARNAKDPTRSGLFKSNPDVLEMADELAADLRYQDDFIYMSSRIVALKKDPRQMTFMDEIYCIYIEKQSTNFVPTGKDVILSTARGDIRISVYARKKETIDRLGNMLMSVSPNARVGYNPDNLQYAAAMKKQWKEYRLSGMSQQ